MDILQQIATGTEKEFTICGVKMTLSPMSSEMMLVFGEPEKGKEMDTMYEMILHTLKKVDSTITLEGVKGLPITAITELTTAIVGLNGLEMADVKAEK
jgi:hypothetical protein